MDHYFTYNSDMIHKNRLVEYEIDGLKISLNSDNNVFSNTRLDEGTRILIETLLHQNLQGKILDLGCGYGPVGITLKLLYKNLMLTMSDVNPLCVNLTSENLKKYKLDDVDLVLSDSYSNIDNQFDVVAFNPPISCGKKKIYSMYEDTMNHLSNHGRFYIVIRKDKGALSHLKYLSSLFPKTDVIYKEKGYYIILAIKEM